MCLHKAQVRSQSDQVTNTWRTLVSVDAAIYLDLLAYFSQTASGRSNDPTPQHTDRMGHRDPRVTYDITSIITHSEAASRLESRDRKNSGVCCDIKSQSLFLFGGR